MQYRPVAAALPARVPGVTPPGALREDQIAVKEFQREGTHVSVTIGRPAQFPERAGWRCRVRVERETRLEQSQVVAPTEAEVLRMAMELVTSRLGLTGAEFLDGAHVRSDFLRGLTTAG
ncbi:hypothetical protein [Microbacterium aurum]